MVFGAGHAQDFIRHYGKLDRERWKALTVPFIEDPWGDGRATFTGCGPGGVSRINPDRPKRDVQIYREWEQHLRKFGLDNRSINGSADRQDLIIPTDSTPPLKYCAEDVQLSTHYGVPWQSHHAVPLACHERAVPEKWIYSDLMVQEFLAHRFPGAFRPREKAPARIKIQQNARRRAGLLAACLYMAFRCLASYEEIAAELHIEADHALRCASDGRRHGDEYFAGKKCCRNRNRRHSTE